MACHDPAWAKSQSFGSCQDMSNTLTICCRMHMFTPNLSILILQRLLQCRYLELEVFNIPQLHLYMQ